MCIALRSAGAVAACVIDNPTRRVPTIDQVIATTRRAAVRGAVSEPAGRAVKVPTQATGRVAPAEKMDAVRVPVCEAIVRTQFSRFLRLGVRYGKVCFPNTPTAYRAAVRPPNGGSFLRHRSGRLTLRICHRLAQRRGIFEHPFQRDDRHE